MRINARQIPTKHVEAVQGDCRDRFCFDLLEVNVPMGPIEYTNRLLVDSYSSSSSSALPPASRPPPPARRRPTPNSDVTLVSIPAYLKYCGTLLYYINLTTAGLSTAGSPGNNAYDGIRQGRSYPALPYLDTYHTLPLRIVPASFDITG